MLLCVVAVCVVFLLAVVFHVPSTGPSISHDSAADIDRMVRLIQLQNETISALSSHVTSSGKADVNDLLQLLKDKDAEIERLTAIAAHRPSQPSTHTPSVALSSQRSGPLSVPPSTMEASCEARFGMQLVDDWRASKQEWCVTENGAPMESKLLCYPHKQHHKASPDMFCEATNFIIDFSKISGQHGTKKPTRGDQYLSFRDESLLSPCKKTDRYKPHLFMPHHRLQMARFTSGVSNPTYDITHEPPTYLLARDEDCENSFHSTADFMNMFLVQSALGLNPHDVQVVLFDKHTDGPYYDLIHRAYGPNHPILRHTDFNNKKVLFKRLVFHLESPAGLIFPKVANPDPLRCVSTSLFQAYRKHVLRSFDLWDVPPPPIPSITLSLRHRTPAKNVGRIMANEEEVSNVLRSIDMAHVQIVDTAKMSFYDQLKLIRNTNILVGIHGAGLMFIMFAAEEAILVEIHPSYRQDRHFRHASRMTNKIYMPLRATARETCQGSSDNVVVPIEEFKRTIDGAVRIARSFDDGLSECGMTCNPGLLALDKRLDPYYKKGTKRSPPINTRFPCG